VAVLSPRKQEKDVFVRPAHPILLEMAELISRRGWCQGTLEDPHGRLCVLGAFHKLLDQDDTWVNDDYWEHPYRDALWAFERAISEEPGVHADPAEWNDVSGRTKFEVIDTLRRVGWLGK